MSFADYLESIENDPDHNDEQRRRISDFHAEHGEVWLGNVNLYRGENRVPLVRWDESLEDVSFPKTKWAKEAFCVEATVSFEVCGVDDEGVLLTGEPIVTIDRLLRYGAFEVVDGAVPDPDWNPVAAIPIALYPHLREAVLDKVQADAEDAYESRGDR